MNSFPVAVPEAVPPPAMKARRSESLQAHKVETEKQATPTQASKAKAKQETNSGQKPKSFQKLLESQRVHKTVPTKPGDPAKLVMAGGVVNKAAEKVSGQNSKTNPQKVPSSAEKKLLLLASGKKIQLAKSGVKKLTPPAPPHKKKDKKNQLDGNDVVVPAVIPQLLPGHPKVVPATAKVEFSKKVGKEAKTQQPLLTASLTSPTLVKGDTKPQGPKLTLLDLRHPTTKAPPKPTTLLASAVTAVENKEAPKTADNKTGNNFQAVFQSVSGNTSQNFAVSGPSPQVPTQDLSALHKFLNSEGPGKIAEQARFILKDNDRGEIRLTLYPESLGKVKIALNLNGHHLDGRIFVENQSVKDVFQQNLNSLAQSLKDSGWNDLSLNVSVGGQDQQRESSDRQSTEGASVGYGHQVKSEVVQASGGSVKISGWGDRLVNLQA